MGANQTRWLLIMMHFAQEKELQDEIADQDVRNDENGPTAADQVSRTSLPMVCQEPVYRRYPLLWLL